jgi:predicted ATPase
MAEPAAATGTPADSIGRYSQRGAGAFFGAIVPERVLATGGDVALSDADAPVICEICRRLDGIPLAIEFAAARTATFGVAHVASGLNDRFALLTSGRRTALPRQQTLRATIDWSYDLLPASEQIVLRRLGVFRGDFTMEAACDIAGDAQLSRIEVVDNVANLAAKSLVATDIGGEVTYHRLLDTTRAYALEKLIESGEVAHVSRRHAEYCRELFAPAEADSESRSQAEWLALYARHLDNLRAGLDWAFSPEGDAETGVALTVAAIPLWFATINGRGMPRPCRTGARHAGARRANRRPR